MNFQLFQNTINIFGGDLKYFDSLLRIFDRDRRVPERPHKNYSQ